MSCAVRPEFIRSDTNPAATLDFKRVIERTTGRTESERRFRQAEGL